MKKKFFVTFAAALFAFACLHSHAFADDATSTATSTDPGLTVFLSIRNGSELAYQGTTTIATGTVSIAATDGTLHDVSGDTPLAALELADQSSTAFSISNLQFFDSFGSFYVKCITLSTEACDNWQYAVNG